MVDRIFLLEPAQNPLTTVLTSVGKNYDGQTWKGKSLMKKTVNNPEFHWLNFSLVLNTY